MDEKLITGLSVAAVIMFICFSFLALTIRKVFKEQDRLKLLFEQIRDICNNAETLEQCNAAWDKLYDECADEYGWIKVHKSYLSDFYECRALLLGKFSILKK